MEKKRLIILVPGSRPKGIPFFSILLDSIYNLFGVKTNFDFWVELFHEYLEDDREFNIRTFFWNGGITRTFSLSRASDDLAMLLDTCSDKYDEIYLFGKSLGGTVCALAANKMQNYETVKRVVFVSTPHRTKNIRFKNSNMEVFNIYSGKDYFVSFANIFLNFGMGTKILNNAENIELKEFKHSVFNQNLNLNINGKKTKVFEFYRGLIED